MLSFCTSTVRTILSAASIPVRHAVRHAARHVPHLHVHQAVVHAGLPHPSVVTPNCAHVPGSALPAGPGHALVPGPASGSIHGGNGAEYVHASASNGGASGLGTGHSIRSPGTGSGGMAAAFGSPLTAGIVLLAGTLALGGLATAVALAFWSATPGQQTSIVPVMQLDLAAVASSVFSMMPSPAAGVGPAAAEPGIAADSGLAGPALPPNTVSVAEPANVPEPVSLALVGIGAMAAVVARLGMGRHEPK